MIQDQFFHQIKKCCTYNIFGDITIGPVSELNSILPLQYEYYESSNSGKFNLRITNNYTKFLDYPKTQKNQKSDLIISSGLFHKFKFLVNNRISRFPRHYVTYMEEQLKKDLLY